MTGLLFDLPKGVKPLPAEIARSADLSGCGLYRFSLTRAWRPGKHVCFIGLNPSTADHRKDDPTVLRWTHFAWSWGYGGFVAVNLYPYRSSSPAACRKWAEEEAPNVRLQENTALVAREAVKAAIAVACWGGNAWDAQHVDAVRRAIARAGRPKLHCLGLTDKGDPKHPMARGAHRVPDSQKPIVWSEQE